MSWSEFGSLLYRAKTRRADYAPFLSCLNVYFSLFIIMLDYVIVQENKLSSNIVQNGQRNTHLFLFLSSVQFCCQIKDSEPYFQQKFNSAVSFLMLDFFLKKKN